MIENEFFSNAETNEVGYYSAEPMTVRQAREILASMPDELEVWWGDSVSYPVTSIERRFMSHSYEDEPKINTVVISGSKCIRD
jgi:hypothetical protein